MERASKIFVQGLFEARWPAVIRAVADLAIHQQSFFDQVAGVLRLWIEVQPRLRLSAPAREAQRLTAKLAEALVATTRRVDDFADKVGYDFG